MPLGQMGSSDVYVHAEDVGIFGEDSDIVYMDYTSLGISVADAFFEGHIEEDDVVTFLQNHGPSEAYSLYEDWPKFCKHIDDKEKGNR